ncbi:hypothetical protein KFK09_014881 [Dendrobium nobile]|uniref:Tf2-1-like SH3-like domain-containing protein n=1 Tax=Dendrobium nobile TaxID=94219 RepID=A0A8T3B4K6_DENNO|nr:hypothetical protein KFK09_014881 [Dendrobium nobile]
MSQYCNNQTAQQFHNILEEVHSKLNDSNSKYNKLADEHLRHKVFNLGDLVMLRVHREHFPPGSYSKLSMRKNGPFPVLHKINDNAYVINLPAHIQTSTTFTVIHIHQYHPSYEANIDMSSPEESSSEDGHT